MLRFLKTLIFLSFPFLLAGCAGLLFQIAPVNFAHPFFQTTFSDLPPSEAESAGVPLMFKVPEAGKLTYSGNIILFAREKEGKAIKFNFNISRLEKFTPSEGKGFFTHEIRDEIDKDGGTIYEKMVLSPSGRIEKYIKGEHRSKLGKFDVINYERSQFFPDHPVKIGDSWTYEEAMTTKIRSFWIKQKKPSHKKITSRATLKGFTTAGGRRVAVILTEAEEKSTEEFSIMFKSLEIDVGTKIEEIIYFDYTNGLIVRRLTNTLTNNTVLGLGFTDVGKSQSYFYLDEQL